MARVFMMLIAMLLMGAAPPSWLPDPAVTPGAVNPDITPANMRDTICNPNWHTGSIRPPAYLTNRLKGMQLHSPRYKDKRLGAYEEDHLISIELGGAPANSKNLWPEEYAGRCGARTKDRVENVLHRLVCNGTLGLREAQREIATDWVAAYRKHVGPLQCTAPRN